MSDPDFLIHKIPKAAKLARFVPASILFARMSTRQPEVALTFDDGPHPEYTPRILEVLKQFQAKATFFVIGQNARRYPDLIQRMVAEGHSLGCHTDTHVDLSRIGLRRSWDECRQSQRSLEQISGQRIRLIRPPWGRIRIS